MSQNNNTAIVRSGADFKPLPRGRHKLDLAALKTERRDRLLQAMQELMAAKGYAATTVPEVVALARVSRNAFYEFFKDKQDCYLALCAEYGTSLHRVSISHMDSADWRTALREGLRDYLRWWQEHPEFARVYFLEASIAGDVALAEREKTYLPFEKTFTLLAAWIRKQNPKTVPLPARVPRMLVIVIMGMLAAEVRAGRERQVTQLEGDLWFVITRLLGADPA